MAKKVAVKRVKPAVKKVPLASSSAWGIILSSGQPNDFGVDIEPAFLSLGSKPILAYSLSAFERCADVEGLILVAPKERLESLRSMVQLFGCNKVKAVVVGPSSRMGAVQQGLATALENGAGVVTIHEGTRPGLTAEQISETIRVARKHGAAALARPIRDPVCEAAKGAKITGAVEGGVMWNTLSPQSFKVDVLQKALDVAAKKKLHHADEAAAVFANKQDVHLVPTKRPMVRIVGPLDLNMAEFFLRY